MRRSLSAPLLPASLLLAVLTSVVVTTALASFGTRALPVAAHQRLASSRAATVGVSGQIDAARARADLPVIRSAMRSALGAIPFSILSARWFDQLDLPAQSGLNKTALIQAAALDGVRQHVVLTAGAWPAGQRPGAAPRRAPSPGWRSGWPVPSASCKAGRTSAARSCRRTCRGPSRP